MSNRTTLAQIREMDAGQIARLPIDHLALLADDVAELKADTKRISDKLAAALDIRFGEAATAARCVEGMLEIGHGMLGDKLDVGRPGPAHGGIAACPPYHREQDVLAEILPISLRQAAALADFLSKMFSGCGGNVCKTLIPFEGTFAQFVQLLIHGSFHPPVPCVGVQNRPRLEPQGRGTMVRNGD